MTDPVMGDRQWYRDAVIYSVHVRSFQDSNGDGFGDFRGLTRRLDYLKDLGVTALWLLPFYPSPLRDDGYDIADYTSIHPDYGTMRQFKRFVREAHARDLKVITELVINHTSDQHPWFQRAVQSPVGSRYRDWYIWSDDPEVWPDVRIIFQDFENSNWEWHPAARQYYWHRFYSHQPDLNFDNPEVRDAVKRVLDFWADTGVDGFRLDAIPYLFTRDGTNGENLPETHAYLKELRTHLDTHWPGRMFLAEANQWPDDAAAYFGDGDECHMNFHFPLMPRLFMAVSQEDRFPILDILQQTPETPEGSQWALFLRNHDELTLEMVSDEERDYMYRAYAREPRMRINLGIRRRLAPLLGNDRRVVELMNGLLFSLPGTPVVYYGDEIGMGDNVYLGDRNGVRTPMQWTADRNAGFSDANPQSLYLPVVIDPSYHYERTNVEWQQSDQSSLLWWMKHLIAQRKRHAQLFGRGAMRELGPDNHKVLAFVREATEVDDPQEVPDRVLVIANLSRHAQPTRLDLSDYRGLTPIEMLGRTAFPVIGDQPYQLTLGPYQFFWFSLEDAPDPLTLSQMGEHTDGGGRSDTAPPTVTLSGEWRALFRGRGRERLEAVLPEALRRHRWFGGKARDVRGCEIVDVAQFGTSDVASVQVLLVRVDFVDGEPEDFVVPVRFVEMTREQLREADPPTGVLALVRGRGSRGQTGVLVDALHEPAAARALVDVIARSRTLRSTAGELVGRRIQPLGTAQELDEWDITVLHGEQSNTSLLVEDRFVVKVLRRLGTGISPEVEIGTALADHPVQIPELLGTLDYRPRGGTPRTLALVQRYVPNEGDAWTQTLDELERFAERVVTEPPARRPRSATTDRDQLEMAVLELPEDAYDLVGPYLDTAVRLGERIAELHIALTGITDDEAFTAEPFSYLSQRSLYQAMRNTLRRGLRSARAQLDAVPDPVARDQIRALAEREAEILDRLQDLSTTPIRAVRTRTHGDLHLGQVLWTGRDFVVIDFEGEPARPLSERQLKRSPLRDVAGMLRSFHYAAYSALGFQVERGTVEAGTAAFDELEGWLRAWHRCVTLGFLHGYLTTAEGQPFLPDERGHTAILLDAFRLEKAIYELGYEMNNRPQWVHIPLAGIAEVLDPPS